RTEPPIVAGVTMDVEIERAGQQQGPIRTQHAVDFVETPPEAGYVFQGVHGDNGSHGSTRLRQRFHVRHEIDPLPWLNVHADGWLCPKQRPQVGNLFLAGHLLRADFQDRTGQIEGLRNCPDHAVEKLVHAAASSKIEGGYSAPACDDLAMIADDRAMLS